MKISLLLVSLFVCWGLRAMEHESSSRTFVAGPIVKYILESDRLDKNEKNTLELMIDQASHPQRALGLDEYENNEIWKLVKLYEQLATKTKAPTKKESIINFITKIRKPIEVLGIKSNESTKLLQDDLHAEFIKLCKDLVAYAYRSNHISDI